MSGAGSGDEAATPATPRIVVTGGGAVDAATLAALTVALTPVGGAEPPAERAGHRIGGWAYAAVIEGIGGRPPTSAPDLAQGRFGLGHVGHPS